MITLAFTQEGHEELEMALELFTPSESDARIPTTELREILTKTGSTPFTDAEFSNFMSVADPQGTGFIAWDDFKKLPCWSPEI